jgi:protein tyrosine phosphatase (PTP) superfamily phosphohydrolase (DUF442 family)
MTTADIYNAIRVSDQILTAGQPTEEQLQAAAAEGFATVINLATLHPDRPVKDEAGLVQSLGMTYHHIPVEWGSPNDSDFDAFDQVMSGLPNSRTLIHCAANFRVTAFFSLYAQKRLGWSAEQAESFRAQVWTGSDYPVWEQFIAHTRARLTDGA